MGKPLLTIYIYRAVSRLRKILRFPKQKAKELNSKQPIEWAVDIDPTILAQVLDRIAFPTFVISNDHIILFWNKALESLSGLKREDMIGTTKQWKPFYSTSRPCLADLIVEGGHDEAIERHYRGKYKASGLIPESYEAEDFFPECGEQGEWLHFTAASLLNSKGNIIGAIETLTNISARKKAELELIERERIYQQLSITDALTGLKNSRHFADKIEEALENSKRYSHSFSLCFLDLDNFKILNDTHGHLIGNSILAIFGKLIIDCLRINDSAYRYGGDEFALILPSTDYTSAINLADRIREKVYKHIFSATDTLVTVSIGVTEYKMGDDAQAIFSRADVALYEAKKLGKNRTIYQC
ncbi:sensor domain-containing diguanylate cyclase [Neptunomonas sp.]|uniref:sensor domain-containing diguanylate cyclase n=1 Tax=Neptunomonas sp. TaxID=1971898 RepID=UPI0025E0DD95|nr:sensor domain-containing diguanylate cyclase [Neptunomonas sp.]